MYFYGTVTVILTYCLFSSGHALSIDEQAMIRIHADSCMAKSYMDRKVLDLFVSGEIADTSMLQKHVYCILQKCKIVGKDGKLHKAVLNGKTSNKNETKVLEACSKATGKTPEDTAFNIFQCAYEKKTILFNFMPYLGKAELDNN